MSARVRELLRDLRGVPVLRHAVGADALVDGPEKEGLVDAVARTGDARLRVDDDVVADEAGRRRREEREERGGRIAAGIRDELRAAEPVAMAFGQAVHRLSEERGRRVLVPVPLAVERGIPEAEIAPDVDDDASFGEPGRRALRGLAGRQRREHDLGLAHVVAYDERPRRVVQVRLDRPECLAMVASRDGGDEPRLRMPQEEPGELAAGIPGRADDRHIVHGPTMQESAYLCKVAADVTRRQRNQSRATPWTNPWSHRVCGVR